MLILALKGFRGKGVSARRRIGYRFQAPVVQKLDSAIHRINHYPVDKSLSSG